MNQEENQNGETVSRSVREMTYEEAGVSINKAEELVRRLKKKFPDIGGFSGLYPLELDEYENPALVASTDGVGTKLLIARDMKRHNTIGIDLVAMVVNDLVCCGARPLFFLDYFATGRLRLDQAEQVLSGIIEGCRRAGCLLLGGETAEMPGMYSSGKYDLAGFGVGIVEKNKIIDGSKIEPGDLFYSLDSNGLHSNGYSLARKVLVEKVGLHLKGKPEKLGGCLGDILLKPTLIYSGMIQALVSKIPVKGIANITGGGIAGNLGRILPQNIDAALMADSILKNRGDIFHFIMETGLVSLPEMFRTFNMGVGMIVAISPSDEDGFKSVMETREGDIPYNKIGRAVGGSGKVRIQLPSGKTL